MNRLAVLRLIAVIVLVLGVVLAAGCAAPPAPAAPAAAPAEGAEAAAPVPEFECEGESLDFTDLAIGSVYAPNDIFVTGPARVLVQSSPGSTGQGGQATVMDANQGDIPGSSGHSIMLTNVNLTFFFNCPMERLSLLFAEKGGSYNIAVNHDPAMDIDHFVNLHSTVIGDVEVIVDAEEGAGFLSLAGDIYALSIGGSELEIGNLCAFLTCETVQEPECTSECVDFTDLTLGTRYPTGKIFFDSGARISVREFQWSNQLWTTNGFAEVMDSGQNYWSQDSGLYMWTNNANLHFDFGCPIQFLQLRFVDWGGNMNLEVNGELANVGDLTTLDGQTVGGVTVRVETDPNVTDHVEGMLSLEGPIESVSIGGQEFGIDDICPEP